MMFLVEAKHEDSPEMDTPGEIALSFGEMMRHGVHSVFVVWAEQAEPGDTLEFTNGLTRVKAKCVAVPALKA